MKNLKNNVKMQEWKLQLVGFLFIIVGGFISCTQSTVNNAGTDNAKSINADVIVTNRSTLDFPVGSCGGFTSTGVRWTAPENMVVNITGGAWRARAGRQGLIFSMWVKNEPVIKNILIYGTSKSTYTFSRMIADQKSGITGEYDFVELVSQQGQDETFLKDISFEKGDEVYIKVEGGNFVGLNLSIGKYDLSKDFNIANNPNGAWAYGAVEVDNAGIPKLLLFDSKSYDYDISILPKGQPAWTSTTLSGRASLMKLDGVIPVTPEIRYDNGSNIYVEALVNGEWEGLYWSADHHIKYEWEYWTPLDSFENNSFELVINDQLLSENWTVVSHGEIDSDKIGKHYMVELLNNKMPVNVKVHTLLDGTPILQRWLEITNLSDKSIAINSIYPWVAKMMARADYREEYAGNIEHAFRLGNFTKKEHLHEGWFEWRTLTEGITEIGCQEGSCFDDPFFIIRNEIRGQYLIGALAWPTNWHMELECNEDFVYMARLADVLSFKIGPQSDTPLYVLAPNESTKSPAVHMGYVSGNLDDAVNAMHEHVRRSVIPSRNTDMAHLIQFSIPGDQGYSSSDFGDPSNFTEDEVKKRVDMAAAIGVELFTVDARWWDFHGDWTPSKTRFPNGIKPIADYVHSKGMLFGLYAEIERAGVGCKILNEYPEWQGPGDALKINDPEVAEYVEKEWRRIIEEYDIDLFRLDFNAFGTKQGAQTERDGFTENNYWRYYENFFAIVERLRKDYPNVIFQQCAIGGGRNDYATVSRFDESYLTDGLRIPRLFQVYSGQSLALPPEIFVTLIGADGCYSVGTSEDLNTYFRATFTLGTPFIFEGMTAKSLGEMNSAVKEGFLKYGKIYKEFIRPILPTCKTYHHAPVDRLNGVNTNPWFAMEYTNPTGTKGWATIAKIGGADSDEYIFKPRGLDQSKTYILTIDSSGMKIEIDGFSLVHNGILVRLDAIGHSELLMFEAK